MMLSKDLFLFLHSLQWLHGYTMVMEMQLLQNNAKIVEDGPWCNNGALIAKSQRLLIQNKGH